MSKFERIYPFTTECISGYMQDLNVGGKSVLTVGSSGDQAFNAFLYGATDVTLFDVNSNAKSFVDMKTNMLLDSNSVREFFYSVINDKTFEYNTHEMFPLVSLKIMNDYMSTPDLFKKLQRRMVVNEVENIVGNVFTMDESLKGRMFDVINLSNVLQYYEPTSMDMKVIRRELLELFNMFISHLKDNGTLMLSYLYDGKNLKEGISLYDLLRALDEDKYIISGVSVPDNALALIYNKR